MLSFRTFLSFAFSGFFFLSPKRKTFLFFFFSSFFSSPPPWLACPRQALAADEDAASSVSDAKVEKEFLDNPLYNPDKMQTAVEHANIVTRVYGVEVLSINIISVTPGGALFSPRMDHASHPWPLCMQNCGPHPSFPASQRVRCSKSMRAPIL